MVIEQVIARARSQLRLGTRYRLGGGKTIPSGIDCRDELNSADCSAFVLWVLKTRKYQADEFWWLAAFNGGWLNTDGIYYDATLLNEPTGNFKEIPTPEPGAVVVFPASWVTGIYGPKIGHCGIVTKVHATRKLGYDVIHCSSGNYKRTGDAIQETNSRLFERIPASIFAWSASVRPRRHRI